MEISDFSKLGGKIMDLSRIRGVLKKLGNPQNSLKFVHIAGTNGKGSVLELASQAVINAGYKVGQFTSPFNIVFEDRIRINSVNIPKSEFDIILKKIEKYINKNVSYSQFEIIFAVALVYFVKNKCDIVFLEAGIGGLLDCTNVVDNVLVTVFTSISKDHTQILGKTITEIANQKAGIIKNGVPIVISYQRYANSFYEIAREKNCKIFDSGEAISPIFFKNPKMKATYQLPNIKTAVQTVFVLREAGFQISDYDIIDSIQNVQLPSRFETISANPLVIIDGAHNTDAMFQIRKEFQNSEKVIAIFGVQKSKAYRLMAGNLSKISEKVVIVDDFCDSACKADVLKKFFSVETTTKPSRESLSYALTLGNPVLICGSLYLRKAVVEDGDFTIN